MKWYAGYHIDKHPSDPRLSNQNMKTDRSNLIRYLCKLDMQMKHIFWAKDIPIPIPSNDIQCIWFLIHK